MSICLLFRCTSRARKRIIIYGSGSSTSIIFFSFWDTAKYCERWKYKCPRVWYCNTRSHALITGGLYVVTLDTVWLCQMTHSAQAHPNPPVPWPGIFASSHTGTKNVPANLLKLWFSFCTTGGIAQSEGTRQWVCQWRVLIWCCY